MDNFFSRLLVQLQQKMPFVVYRKPVDERLRAGKEVKAFLQQDATLYKVKDFTESGFVFAPFDTGKPTVIIPEKVSEVLTFSGEFKPGEEITAEKRFMVKAEDSGKTSREDISEERENHIALVQKGVGAIKAGKLDKVVLSRKELISLQHDEPIVLFRGLMENYPTAFVYCWYHPEVGLWLGATPETLVQLKGSSFSTMALAGTQKYEGSMKVKWGAKELQEQQYVTDSVVENLRELGLQTELSAPTGENDLEHLPAYTTKAGSLLHLRTDIVGSVPPNSGLQRIVEALHPTPAVCGLPKEKAKEFILKEEPYDREFYTGYLGELNLAEVKQRSRNRRNVENLAYSAVRKQSALYVNLRCMKLQDGKAMLFIGGGITRDSNPEEEWQETVNKAGTMKKVLK